MPNPSPFAVTLRETRIAKGYSLRDFANRIGISPTYLSRVENGDSPDPTQQRVRAIAALLGRNVDEWLALAGHVPSDVCDAILCRPALLSRLVRATESLLDDEVAQLIEHATHA